MMTSLNTWIDQTNGDRWTGLARIRSVNSEVVLEQNETTDEYRLVREFGGDAPRIVIRDLPANGLISAMMSATATVVQDLEAPIEVNASPVRPGKAE